MAGIIKVAIHYNSESFYYNLNSTKSLRENIENICAEHNIPGHDSWGLKLKDKTDRSKSSKNSKISEEYYYIEDFSNVLQGDELKLVSSIKVKIDFIFKNYNDIAFADLAKENTDRLFLFYIVEYKNHSFLLNYILEEEYPNDHLKICYQTILQILKYNLLSELPDPIVSRMVNTVKDCKVEHIVKRFNESRERPHTLECVMSILCQLMIIKDCPTEIKQEITSIPIKLLIQMCRLRSMKFQLKPLKLLNSIVSAVKDEGKIKLLQEMDSLESRNIIFEYVVQDLKKCNDIVGKEVYVYQCTLLNRLMDKLESPADPDALRQYECTESSENRLSDILEFQETSMLDYKGKWSSNDTIISCPGDYRYSIQSVSSRDSITTIRSYQRVDEGVRKLTEECLEYYAAQYEMNFNQSKLEEAANQSKITISADRIVRMLASILRIGSRVDKKREDFQPLVFNTSLKQGFFMELFCRTMWLLSKTRREMQAYVADDFDKVLHILEQQVRKTLEWKPLTLTELLKQMKTMSYKTICDSMEKELEINWKNNMNNNPCVQLLKVHFKTGNEELIQEQRLSVLKAGQEFPKLPEVKAKKQQYFTVELSPNCKKLLYYDCNAQLRRAFTPVTYNVSTIRHLIIGASCPLYKDNTVKNQKCLFALQLEGDHHIHFLAKDEKMADYWKDGLRLLLGKTEHYSESYKKELEELTEMDIALQLLELQNIDLPDQAPPLPLVPPRPPLPPRAPYLKQLSQSNSTK